MRMPSVRPGLPKLSIGKRKPPKPTVRSLGAEIFDQYAQEMHDETRRLLNGVMSGKITAKPDGETPDFVGLVRRQRQSLLQKIEDEQLLNELMERMRRAAVLMELQQHFPDLVEAAMRQQDRLGEPEATTVAVDQQA